MILKKFFQNALDLCFRDYAYGSLCNLSVLEEDKGRDAADAVLDGDVLAVIDVAFYNLYFTLVLLCDVVYSGGKHAAGTAPNGPKIYHYRLVRSQNLCKIAVGCYLCHNLINIKFLNIGFNRPGVSPQAKVLELLIFLAECLHYVFAQVIRHSRK